MNAKNIIAAAAIFAATGSAFAQGNSEFVEFTNVVSSKSRAEVKAEITQASTTPEFVEYTRVASTTPRPGIVADTRAAYGQGLLGQAPEFVEHVNVASSRSRAEVRGEALQAAKPGRNAIGG